jgi:hypothetical protein
MESEEFLQWAGLMASLVLELASFDFGYLVPISANQFTPPISTPIIDQLPGMLIPLYRVCDGLRLPDVHNGYFLMPAKELIESKDASSILQPSGLSIPVCVFGSDGGGSRFAVGTIDHSVYYVPSTVGVEGNMFIDGSRACSRKVSKSVVEFLMVLLTDVYAFVDGNTAHVFLEMRNSTL